MTIKKEDLNSDETVQRLFHIEAEALKGGVSSEDVLWLLELNNVQHSEIEKYQKFVAAVIELGPDGVAGLVDYLQGNTVPFDPENYPDE